MRDKKKPSTAPTASIDPGDYCYGVPSADAVCHLMAVFMFHHAAAHYAMFHHAAAHCAAPQGQSIAARVVDDASLVSGCRRRRSRAEGAVEGVVKARKTRLGSIVGPMAPFAPFPTPLRSPIKFDTNVDAPLPRGAVSSLLLLDDDDNCGSGIYRSRALAPRPRSDVPVLDANNDCGRGGGGGCGAQLQGGTFGGACRVPSSLAAQPSSGVSSCCADALSEMCIESLYSFVSDGNADDALLAAWQLSSSGAEETESQGCTDAAFCSPHAW